MASLNRMEQAEGEFRFRPHYWHPEEGVAWKVYESFPSKEIGKCQSSMRLKIKIESDILSSQLITDRDKKVKSGLSLASLGTRLVVPRFLHFRKQITSFLFFPEFIETDFFLFQRRFVSKVSRRDVRFIDFRIKKSGREQKRKKKRESLIENRFIPRQ